LSKDQLLQEVRAAFRRHGQAGDAMDQAAADFLGVHRTDTRVLDVLDMNGRMSAGEVAKAVKLSPAAVTASLDRLERVGYLRRIRDDEDRRRVLIEPTKRLSELSWELYGPLAREGDRLLGGLTIAQLRLLRDVLRESGRLQFEQAELIRGRLDGAQPRTDATRMPRR
jgi:DNA-binding MarR family transcriptional regulator